MIPRTRRVAFTLVELLVAMAVASLLAATALVAMWSAQEEARLARTNSQIRRINELILRQWEGYTTRSVRPPAATRPDKARQIRLLMIRDLMRLELPDRITDVLTPPLFFSASDYAGPGTPPVTPPNDVVNPVGFNGSWYRNTPHLWRRYVQRVGRLMDPNRDGTVDFPWTPEFQQAECLYLILAEMRDGDRSALSYFRDVEIQNLDGDAVPEIVDGWGNPIGFLRWAPGFSELAGYDGKWGQAGVDDDGDGVTDNYTEAGWTSLSGSDDMPSPSFIQTRNAAKSPDPFDSFRVDPRWSDSDRAFDPYLLYPLIYCKGGNSADLPPGDDGLIVGNEDPSNPYRYRQPAFVSTANWYQAMDPYQPATLMNGSPGALIGTLTRPLEWPYLITNHTLEGR